MASNVPLCGSTSKVRLYVDSFGFQSVSGNFNNKFASILCLNSKGNGHLAHYIQHQMLLKLSYSRLISNRS